MTRPDEIAALADELDKRVKFLAGRSRVGDAILMQRAAKALRLSATSPGDAVRDWQPIETAPRDGSKIWLRDTKLDPTDWIGNWYFHPSVNGWVADELDCGDYDFSPTKWRPLDAALATAEKAGDVVQTQDVRWGVSVLLETIAKKFEENDTLDIWKSDAAALVRGFKHATPTPPSGDVAQPRWRHKVRGTTYTEIGRGRAQTTASISDYEGIVVYRSDEDGTIWVRPVEEFDDGRFELIQSAAHGGGTKSDGLCPVPPGKNEPVSTETASDEGESIGSANGAAARRMPDNNGSLAHERSTQREDRASPGPSDADAYLVDGRVEQGLFFDRESAEIMADANCGNVVPLYRHRQLAPSDPAQEPQAVCVGIDRGGEDVTALSLRRGTDLFVFTEERAEIIISAIEQAGRAALEQSKEK